jgi:hypothetical protein
VVLAFAVVLIHTAQSFIPLRQAVVRQSSKSVSQGASREAGSLSAYVMAALSALKAHTKARHEHSATVECSLCAPSSSQASQSTQNRRPYLGRESILNTLRRNTYQGATQQDIQDIVASVRAREEEEQEASRCS